MERPLLENVRAVIERPERLAALAALDLPDPAADTDFERLSRTTAHLFKAEYGLVTLIGKDRQVFRGCFGIEGIDGNDTPLSFCAHALVLPDDEPLIVLDASLDERFASNPIVTGWPHIRFYAGAPIVLNGEKIGSLCVLSPSPRTDVDPLLLQQLVDLAQVTSALFALKDEARVRAKTAAALMREEWRHALTLEAGKVGSWVLDVVSGELSCNDMFRRMYGLPETGLVTSEQLLAATHSADREAVEQGMRASLIEGVDYDVEARILTTGRWLAMRGRVYQRDAEGNALVMMGATTDITEAKQSTEQTRLLLRELNHRVKNTLAMIQSVARQTIRQNPDPKAFIDAFSGRLRTISDAHVLLADRDWSGVQLYEVLASQLGPNFLDKPDRATVSGSDYALPPDHALGLGLILHELTTNAHRYGAWANDWGTVRISWDLKTEPSRGLELLWTEEDGPRVTKPSEIGLGVKLIERSLAKVLDSNVDLDFAPEGVKARVWLPLPLEQA